MDFATIMLISINIILQLVILSRISELHEHFYIYRLDLQRLEKEIKSIKEEKENEQTGC